MPASRLLLLVILTFVLAACERDSGREEAAEDELQLLQPDEPAQTDSDTPHPDAETVVEVVAELPAVAVALAASADNRLFVALQNDIETDTSPLVEISNGRALAWPDDKPPASGKLRGGIRALHIDDEGALWILDASPRLLRIDLMQNQYTREIDLAAAFPGTDHQPDGLGVDAELGVAYIIDSGQPGLVVLDLYTDEARRMLENTSTLQPASDDPDTRARMVLSPDLRYLFWQPRGSGDIYRMETEVLQFTDLPDEELAAMVEHFGTPGPAQALSMDPAGLLYVAVDENAETALRRIDHFGTPSLVSHETGLSKVTAMGATRGGDLLLGIRGDEDQPPRLLRLLGAAR